MKLKQPRKLILAVMSMIHVLELKKSDDNRVEITGGLEGMFVKDALAALGIDYQVVESTDGEYGRLKPNRSWTGLIGMVHRGDADLACGALMMTENRQKAVEFSIPYVYNTQTFVIKKPEKMRLKSVYFYPFHLNVWVGLLVVLIAMSLALWIVFEKKLAPGRIVFELFAIVLRQPFIIGGNLWMSKFLLAIFCVCGLIMTSAYSGVLLSFFTVSVQARNVETLQQLSAAVSKGTHKCYVVKDSLLLPYLLASHKKHIQLLAKAISRNKWYVDRIDKDGANVISPDSAIIWGKYFLDIAYGTIEQQSKFFISKDVVGAQLFGIAMNKNFCCQEKLNSILWRLGGAGMMQKYLREAAFNNYKSTKKVEYEEETNRKISVEDITGALLILSAGYVLSFIELLAEILFSRYCRKHLRI